MTKNLDYYMALPYEILIRPLTKEEGSGYFARYKDFPYIMGDGETEIKALEDVKKAFRGAIEVMLENNDSIIEPTIEAIV